MNIAIKTPASINRHAIIAAWRANCKKATAAQHAVYLMLRGQPLSSGFSPLRRQGKIDSAHGDPDYAMHSALACAKGLECHAFAPWAAMIGEVPKHFGAYQLTPSDMDTLFWDRFFQSKEITCRH